MISHEHKFIFIELNKTGTTSISSLLDKFSEPPEGGPHLHPGHHEFHRHASLCQMLARDAVYQMTGKGFNISDYFKFTFVRNPWDRLVSLYRYRTTSHPMAHELRNRPSHASFTTFVHQFTPVPFYTWLGKYVCRGSKPPVAQRQVDFLYNFEKEIQIDFIGRFETLQTDFDRGSSDLRIPKMKLPHHNKTDHKHYTEYYNNVTRQIVADNFREDIEYLDYKFGE